MIPVHNQKNSTTYRTKSIFETSLFLTPETVQGKWADQSFWPNNFWDHVGGISQWYSRQPLAIHFSNASPPTRSQKSLRWKFILIPLVVSGVGNSLLFFSIDLEVYLLSISVWYGFTYGSSWRNLEKCGTTWSSTIYKKKPQRHSYTFVVSTSLLIIHTCNSQYYRHFPQSWRNQGTFPQMQMQDQMHAKWKCLSTAMHGILEGSNIMHTYI